MKLIKSLDSDIWVYHFLTFSRDVYYWLKNSTRSLYCLWFLAVYIFILSAGAPHARPWVRCIVSSQSGKSHLDNWVYLD